MPLRMSRRRIGMLFDGAAERYGLVTAAANLLGALDRKHVEVTGLFLTRGAAESQLAPYCDHAVRLNFGALPHTRAFRGQQRGLGGIIKLAGYGAGAVRAVAPQIRRHNLELIHSHYWHTFL